MKSKFLTMKLILGALVLSFSCAGKERNLKNQCKITFSAGGREW